MDGFRKAFLGFSMAAAMTTAGFAQERKQDNKKAPTERHADGRINDISGTWSGVIINAAIDKLSGPIFYKETVPDSAILNIKEKGSTLSGDLYLKKYQPYTTYQVHFLMEGTRVDNEVILTTADVIDYNIRDNLDPDNNTRSFLHGIRLEATVVTGDGETRIGSIGRFHRVAELSEGELYTIEGINFRKGTFKEIAKRDAEKEARRQEKIRREREALIKKQQRERERADSIENHVNALRGIEYVLAQNSTKPSLKRGEQHHTDLALNLRPALEAWEQRKQKEKDKHNPRFDPVLFQEGSAEILDMSELERLAEFMKMHPDAEVRITGSTEPRGTPKMLKELSVKRAEAAETILELLGIDPDRVETVGIGSANRLPPGVSDPALNRRVEIEIVHPKLNALGP